MTKVMTKKVIQTGYGGKLQREVYKLCRKVRDINFRKRNLRVGRSATLICCTRARIRAVLSQPRLHIHAVHSRTNKNDWSYHDGSIDSQRLRARRRCDRRFSAGSVLYGLKKLSPPCP